MDKVLPFQLSIHRYKEVLEGTKNVVYYTVEIVKKSNQRWTVEKRYKEFDDLQAALKKLYSNLPLLPGKTLFPIKTPAEIEKRREELERYLKSMIARDDILNSEQVKKFLQIENNAPEATVNPPKLLGEVSSMVLGVRDFHYQPDKGLLFTAISDMSVTSRLDSQLTNMKMPWEKELPPGTLVTVGAIECYIQASIGELKFDRLWTKTYQTQIIVIYWEPNACILVVGGDDGTLSVLKVSSELNFIKYDEVISTKLHLARVMGVYLDNITNFVYTCGEDKKFKVFDYLKNDTIADLTLGTADLTALLVERENKRAFIANRTGQVFIHDISTMVPRLIHIVQAHPKGEIRSLTFDTNRHYLITGNHDDGILAIWDLDKPGKEKFAHNIANLHGKAKVRATAWSTSRTELMSANADGTVTFWNAKKAAPIYLLSAHADHVTKLQWFESKSLLVTGGKDKKIKFFQLPSEWKDKRLEDELISEAKIHKETEAMLVSQAKMKKAQDDSDEDDLAGWHK
jgi:WD40 repeat protein